MFADNSFDVKNINIWSPTFFKHNNSFIAIVKTQNGYESIVDAHLKAIWLDQVSELKPGALNKNFLRYASSNTNMKQKIR